jgi:hypothetical protein
LLELVPMLGVSPFHSSLPKVASRDSPVEWADLILQYDVLFPRFRKARCRIFCLESKLGAWEGSRLCKWRLRDILCDVRALHGCKSWGP